MHSPQLLFSFVIPTFNRPRELRRCLTALAELDYPRDRFEVVVVDDGSPTVPGDIVESFRDRLDICLIAKRNRGPASARNTGAAHARGRYLVFTDDDCSPDADMLRWLEHRLDRAPHAGVGGRTVNALADVLCSVASQDMIDYLFRYHNRSADQARFFTTTNLTLPRDRFEEIGGFDTTFPLAAAEDRELCERWVQHGFELVYAPEVVVRHAHDLALGSFCRQHFNYGRGRYHLIDARERGGRRRSRFEAASFYVGLVGDPLRRERGSRAVKLSSLNLLSQVTYAAGYYLERLRHLPGMHPSLSPELEPVSGREPSPASQHSY
jgi:glycosyltransferase involved in cell wall biosynthesis